VQTLIEHSATYYDEVFAPLDRDHHLERIGGGFETEVYCTDDKRYVVKLKSDLGGDLDAARACIRRIRDTAEQFTRCLGEAHSIPNTYILARDGVGRVQGLVIQPFIRHAHPLGEVDLTTLGPDEREHVAAQLSEIVWRSLAFYRSSGYMPDLYGMISTGHDERARRSRPHTLPRHLWDFVMRRNILRSCNLLLTNSPECRVVLVDYDLVRWNVLIRRIYFAVRWVLGWRDQLLIRRMRRTGVRKGEQ